MFEAVAVVRERGAATASNMFMRIVGQSTGAALFGALLNAGLDQFAAMGHAEAMATALADQEAATGNPRRALEIYDDLLDRVLAWGPKPDVSLPDAVSLSRIYGVMASLCRGTGLTDRAANLEARRLSLWRYWDAKLPRNAFVARQLEAANSGSASTN